MARSLTVELDSPTFSPEGPKGRALGVKVDRLTVGFAGAAPLILPPGWVLVAALGSVLGIFALLWRGLARWGRGARFGVAVIGALLVLAGLLAGLVWLGFQTTWVLGLIGWPLALVGLAAAGWPWLRGCPGWVDRLADIKSYAAPGLLALGLLLYGLWMVQLLPQVPWIGHADYADNAVVARNLAVGRGYVVDYLAQFYRTYPNSTHPAETWPILQPTLIAPFFWLFGAQEWAARLPNLLLLLGLGAAVYAFGARWWDRRVGLLAAGFTLLHPYLFKTVLYPINDLAYVLFALLTLGLAWETVQAAEARVGDGGLEVEGQGPRVRDATPQNPKPKIENDQPPSPHPPTEAQFTGLDMQLARRREAAARRVRRLLLATGIAAGLLIWSKPTGALILVGLAAALWLRGRLTRWAGRKPHAPPAERGARNTATETEDASRFTLHVSWITLALWFLLPFALVLLPLLARNLLTFGQPFYSTESYDAWILRFWLPGDDSVWERIYSVYTGPGRELPHPRLLLGGSFDQLFAAVGRGFRDVWDKGVVQEQVLPVLVVLGAVGGWLLAPRRLYGLLGAWVAALGGTSVATLLYWHYEERYFMVYVPWAYLGLAGGLFWLWDRARIPPSADDAPHQPGRWALAVLPLAVLLLVPPMLQDIATQVEQAREPQPLIAAGEWLVANTPADAVIMTRDPWELNWYSNRRAVMIPMDPPDVIREIGRQYGATYLLLGGPSGSKRPQLAPLYQRQPMDGMNVTEVYHTDEGGAITIYRWQP
jgi:hypothetical protein